MSKVTKIILPENVTSTILDLLIKETKESYVKNDNMLQNVILDLSRIKYIEIEGALALICVCSAIKRKNKMVNFSLVYPKDRVLSYLMTLGFFGQMRNKVGAGDREDIIRIENQQRIQRQRNKSNEFDAMPVILPIETIEQQLDHNSGVEFENMVGKFVSHAMDTFEILRTSPHYNFTGEDYYQFRQSNIELYKNIFHHSKSWGIASVHARPNHGTTVCYYDIGIGFKASVKKFATESESIDWALIDGNTSKLDGDNDGYGLTLIQEFVFRRNGIMKIRSGDCMLILNSVSSKKKIKVSNFPGVQISYFIPV